MKLLLVLFLTWWPVFGHAVNFKMLENPLTQKQLQILGTYSNVPTYSTLRPLSADQCKDHALQIIRNLRANKLVILQAFCYPSSKAKNIYKLHISFIGQ